MTLNGAITELVLLSEHPMMPVIFRPAIQKVIETISELEAQTEQRCDSVSAKAGAVGRRSKMKCKDCEYFRIDYEPYRYIGSHTEPGQASCTKHNLVTNFASKKKLEALSCVDEGDTE